MKKRSRRPLVVATFAMTLDGKITSVDFTSREDKLHLYRERSLGDAVLVGHGTLEKDNVRLGLPGTELRDARLRRRQAPYPLRVVVSNEGRINHRLKIFDTDISPIVIFSTTRMPRKHRAALLDKATLHLHKGRRVDLREMLERLHSEYKVRRAACEGGATLFRALLELDLVDQLNLTIAPYLFGGAKAPTLTGLSQKFLPKAVRCTLASMRVIGDECFLTYRVKNSRQ